MASPLGNNSHHRTPGLADILQKHSINSLLDQPDILSDTNGEVKTNIFFLYNRK